MQDSSNFKISGVIMIRIALIALGLGSAIFVLAQATNHDLGYTDTPILPGLPYHVHDPARPIPRVVTPASPPSAAPSDAIILFDGRDLSKWEPQTWKVQDGYVEVVPGTGDIATREKFGDVQLHLEWATPATVVGTSQGRGN